MFVLSRISLFRDFLAAGVKTESEIVEDLLLNGVKFLDKTNPPKFLGGILGLSKCRSIFLDSWNDEYSVFLEMLLNTRGDVPLQGVVGCFSRPRKGERDIIGVCILK